MTLRAVVIGTGWAGEGHTIGLREAGVEVVALCGRTPEPAYQRAIAPMHSFAIRFWGQPHSRNTSSFTAKRVRSFTNGSRHHCHRNLGWSWRQP